MCSGHFCFFAPDYNISRLNGSSGAQHAHVNNVPKSGKHVVVECDATVARDVKQNIFGGVSCKILQRGGAEIQVTRTH